MNLFTNIKNLRCLLYSEATTRTFREAYQPVLQGFRFWLEPTIRKEVVGPNENFFGEGDKKGALAHDSLLTALVM